MGMGIGIEIGGEMEVGMGLGMESQRGALRLSPVQTIPFSPVPIYFKNVKVIKAELFLVHVQVPPGVVRLRGKPALSLHFCLLATGDIHIHIPLSTPSEKTQFQAIRLI